MAEYDEEAPIIVSKRRKRSNPFSFEEAEEVKETTVTEAQTQPTAAFETPKAASSQEFVIKKPSAPVFSPGISRQAGRLA